MKFVKLFLVIFCSMFFIFLASAFDSNSDPGVNWKMLGGYLNHTSWDGVDFPVISGLNNATFDLGALSFSSPIVFNGFVYVGSGSGVFYQLNASNVTQMISSYTTGAQVYSSPAIVGEYVYVGSNDDNLYQLNASNVSQLISNYTTGGIIQSAPVVSDGFLYASSNLATYQLNASNVSQFIASYTVPTSSTSPTAAGGYLYVSSTDDNLYQLNASNISQRIANYTSGGDFRGSPVVYSDYVYVGSDDNHLYQLNANNVSEKISDYTVSFAGSNDVRGIPSISGDYLYVGTDSRQLFQLNASNVSQLISSYYAGGLGNNFVSAPSVYNGYIYIGSMSGDFFQFNASNVSQVISSFDVSSSIASSSAIANGYVYFSSYGGDFYQVKASNVSLINDVISPVISSVSDSVSTTSATITWTTDENSNSSVDYGGTVSLGSNSGSASLVTSHSVSLSGLSASTFYYYNVTSCDENNNCNITGPYNFTTSANPVVIEEEEPSSGSSPSASSNVVGTSGTTSSGEVTLSYGSKLEFSSDGVDYDVYLRNVDRTVGTATFDIVGDGDVILSVGESQELDVDGDGIVDVVVTLNAIDPDRVAVDMELSLIEDVSEVVVEDEVVIGDEEEVAPEETGAVETFFNDIKNWIGGGTPGAVSPGGSASVDLGFDNVNDVIGQEITVNYEIVDMNDEILNSGIEVVYADSDFTGEIEIVIPEDLDEGNYTIKVEALAANGVKGFRRQALVVEEEPKLPIGPLVVIGILIVLIVVVLHNISRRGERDSFIAE